MPKCSNCGAEVEIGMKFCGECGTPVPQVKKCINCGIELPIKMKFCFECGSPQEGSPAGTGVNMGDKNVIAGDVIGQKVAGDNVQNKIMGNAIYNTIQDDTKRVNSCHVCGKHLTNDNGHTCPGCGNVVCDDHFDARKNLCLKCAETKKQDALKQYESALLSIGANGRIDVIERNKLDMLADSLGLSKADVLPLEQKFKLHTNATSLTQTEQMSLESVKKTYFEGYLDEAYEDVKKLFERYPNDENVVNWYLRFARFLEPKETIDVIAQMQVNFCESYLSLTIIYIAQNQVNEAEIALNKAKQMWPNSTLVKCVEAMLYIKLFKIFNKNRFLEDADKALESIDESLIDDEYESYLIKNEKILLQYLQGNRSNWDDFDSTRFLDLFDLGLYIAFDKDQLEDFIDAAIEEKGLECDLNFIDVSNVTDMSELFKKREFRDDEFNKISEDQMTQEQKRLWNRHLFNGDISKWNVSNVRNMSCMFWGSEFCGDISQWNVSSVSDMHCMFFGSRFNGDISRWDVSSVTGMGSMFFGSRFNGDISQWNVSSVTDMSSMFRDSQFNSDISQWDVSSVMNMNDMFDGSRFNGDISQWNVSSVTDMSAMFQCSQFNTDISQWNVSSVTNMWRMFFGSRFNGDISRWDVSSVMNMSDMFDGSRFNGDISQWNVSKVTNMSAMFQDSQFNGDISQWDVSSVTDMGSMFYGSRFNGDISKWDVSKVTDMATMFKQSQFNGDISQWNVSKETKMTDFTGDGVFDESELEKKGRIPDWYKK